MSAPKSLLLLQMAQALLNGGSVAKAEKPEAEDPDGIEGRDPRKDGAEPTDDKLEDAREEAQAASQAQAEQAPEGDPNAPGAPEPDGDEGQPGPGDGDGDEEQPVAKAEVLESMKFLASMHNITPEEVAKAFTGLEGDPSEGKAPMGKGVDMLQKIVEGQENQNKILDAIASFLSGLSRSHVSLSGEVTKSLAAAETAQVEASKVSAALAGIMKTAPAAPSKGITPEHIAKAEHVAPVATSNDLFQAALRGELSPIQAAAHNRIANQTGAGRN